MWSGSVDGSDRDITHPLYLNTFPPHPSPHTHSVPLSPTHLLQAGQQEDVEALPASEGTDE